MNPHETSKSVVKLKSFHFTAYKSYTDTIGLSILPRKPSNGTFLEKLKNKKVEQKQLQEVANVHKSILNVSGNFFDHFFKILKTILSYVVLASQNFFQRL